MGSGHKRDLLTLRIVTLGSLSIAAGLALVLSGGRPVEVINRVLLDLSTNSVGPLRWMVIVALLVALAAHVLLFHTRFVMPTSGRRLQKQGYLRMAGIYFVNFFSIVFRGKPATKNYTDVR